MNFGYYSHFPILAAAASCTKGPIIEFGAGHGSSLMLHAIARAMGRGITTVEGNKEWMDKFRWMDTKGNGGKFYHALVDGVFDEQAKISIGSVVNSGVRFGLVFVDSQPGEARRHIIEFMSDKADLIVAHDSERDYDSGGNYEYEKVTPLFRYVSEYRICRPYTLILSNTIDFPLSEEEQTWHPYNL